MGEKYRIWVRPEDGKDPRKAAARQFLSDVCRNRERALRSGKISPARPRRVGHVVVLEDGTKRLVLEPPMEVPE